MDSCWYKLSIILSGSSVLIAGYKLNLHCRLKQIIPDRFQPGFVFSGDSFCRLSAGDILHYTQINSLEFNRE